MGLTDAELLAIADRQSAAFFLATRDRPWADVREDPDVIPGTTGIPLPVFIGATKPGSPRRRPTSGSRRSSGRSGTPGLA